MKVKMVSFGCLFLLGTMTLFAQSKTEEFKVYGNCGMCEKRIETAAKSVKGVAAADWNKETKMIDVSYDSTKTDVDKINITIAKVGHDTDMYRADDKVYDELPGCCHYDRPAAKEPEKDHEMHNH
ncbi:MAG: heavy-metal-associated domain-containing protein [Bacteroidales bacterium]|nr:heavy-metal-associated domain-containing protein [Bacteroidales bacterium]